MRLDLIRRWEVRSGWWWALEREREELSPGGQGEVGGSRSIRLLSALGYSQQIAVSSALFVVVPVALLRYN